MKRLTVWKGLLALLLVLSLEAGASAEGMNTGFESLAEEWEFPITEEMVAAIAKAVPFTPVDTELVTVRSLYVAYDGLQVIASANIQAKGADVVVMSDGTDASEQAGDTGKTYEELAAEGKKVLVASCVPTIVEDEGVYFVHEVAEKDGSVTVVTGARLEGLEMKGAPISLRCNLYLRELNADGGAVKTEVGDEITLNPLQPLEEITYKLPEGTALQDTVTLTRSFFGFALDGMDVELVDAEGEPVESAVLGDQSYYMFEETPSPLHVKVGGTVYEAAMQ